MSKNRFNWSDFKKKTYKIAINVKSLDEEKQLFKLFNEHKCTWHDGEKYEIGKNSCFEFCQNTPCYDNEGYYGEINTYGTDYTIYSLSEVINPLPISLSEWLI